MWDERHVDVQDRQNEVDGVRQARARALELLAGVDTSSTSAAGPVQAPRELGCFAIGIDASPVMVSASSSVGVPTCRASVEAVPIRSRSVGGVRCDTTTASSRYRRRTACSGSQCNAVVTTASTGGLGQGIAPPPVSQVGVYDVHAVVVAERRRRDGEEHRIDVHSDRVCPGQPITQSAGDRASATRQVDDGRGSAGYGLDDIQQHADLALPLGDEHLFEPVPRSLP